MSEECECGRLRAGCEYHDPLLQPPVPYRHPACDLMGPPPAPTNRPDCPKLAPTTWATDCFCGCCAPKRDGASWWQSNGDGTCTAPGRAEVGDAMHLALEATIKEWCFSGTVYEEIFRLAFVAGWDAVRVQAERRVIKVGDPVYGTGGKVVGWVAPPRRDSDPR